MKPRPVRAAAIAHTARRGAVAGLLLASLLASLQVSAQELRDPMRPLRSTSVPTEPAGGLAAAPPLLRVQQIVLVGGQRYVVDAGRRRGVGDLLGDAGDARIESIEDGAVVVRRQGQRQRLTLFAGVSKRMLVKPASSGGAANGATPNPTATATAIATATANPPPALALHTPSAPVQTAASPP